MQKGFWKPAGFAKALSGSGMNAEALAVKLQEMGWVTSIHSVLDWKAERSGGPKHLVQCEVIADILGCELSDLIVSQRKRRGTKHGA